MLNLRLRHHLATGRQSKNQGRTAPFSACPSPRQAGFQYYPCPLKQGKQMVSRCSTLLNLLTFPFAIQMIKQPVTAKDYVLSSTRPNNKGK